ncbi:very-long-chain 3-oxoacyl-CoA reductase [Lasioglossum baleicum]|uniref:very-long-chain 3-oxoacyl-CoA reductase n=1 Tax=Lasioglossum baleicum TaxID=434251 RepID=UPI003FCD32EB
MTLTCSEIASLVVLAVIGLRILIRVGILVWRKLIAPSFGLAIDLKSQGKWAVITGATGGIGKAYAEQLAERGIDIVLVARSVSALEEIATEIKQRYNVQVRTIEANLSEGAPVFAKIAKATEDLEVGVVVNNAGVSYDHPELFTELSTESVASILDVNVIAMAGISKVFLPKMFERRKGVLINISSILAYVPSPYLSVYGASKAFVKKLSYDLAAEAEPRGVTVQCVCPGIVATKMTKIKKSTWMAPTPEKYVEASLKTVGIEECTTGYLTHYLLASIIQGLNCVCEKGTIWLISRTMCNLRARGIKRNQKKLNKSEKESVATE